MILENQSYFYHLKDQENEGKLTEFGKFTKLGKLTKLLMMILLVTTMAET